MEGEIQKVEIPPLSKELKFDSINIDVIRYEKDYTDGISVRRARIIEIRTRVDGRDYNSKLYFHTDDDFLSTWDRSMMRAIQDLKTLILEAQE